MRKARLAGMVLTGLLVLQAPALADPIPLEFVPANQEVTLGQQVTVDVFVDPGVDIIAAYDMIIGWDSALLSLSSVVFGPALGAPLDSLQTFIPGAGSVEVAELSFLFDFTGLQGGSAFSLFTLVFDTLEVGTSALTFTGNVENQQHPFNFLGGEFGQALEAAPVNGSVTIVQRVPEPSALLLMFVGLAGLIARRRAKTG